MAKATRAQEVSTGTSDSYTDDELVDPTPPVVITRPILGEVDRVPYRSKEAQSSQEVDGGDSTQSSQSEHKSDDKPNQSRPQHAPTTENPSKVTAKETSDVDSTDGNGHETEPQPSGSTSAGRKTPAKKAAPKKQTGARSTMMRGAEDEDDEFDNFG